MWPDLAKNRHFGQILKVFSYVQKRHLELGIILKLLWQKLYGIGQIFIAVRGQILKNNLAIWSH